jgi:hypothetical protein
MMLLQLENLLRKSDNLKSSILRASTPLREGGEADYPGRVVCGMFSLAFLLELINLVPPTSG